MINARELRIGNLVVANGLHEGQLREVEQIGACGTMRDENRVIMFKDCNVGEFAENLESIPISEAWLLKFGFIKDKERQSYYIDIEQGLGKFDLMWYDGCTYLKSRYQEENLPIQRLPHIKYVHQLQNLYHALTGTSLTPAKIK